MNILHNKLALGLALAALVVAGGCSTKQTKSTSTTTTRSGDAHSIVVSADNTVSQVGGHAVLTATVKDSQGRPVSGAKVEWLLTQGSVGSFLQIEREGSSSDHQRLGSGYAITETNSGGEDDGETWAAMTSPIEGVSHVVAYSPDIADWDRQKATVAVQWRDVEITMPQSGRNRVGTEVPLVVQVRQKSDGAPIAGQEVTFSITKGPQATLTPGGSPTTIKTDAQGIARTTLRQSQPVSGENEVRIRVVRPANEKCCLPAVLLADELRRYAWVAPSIDIEKTAPARATINEEFNYTIVVKAGTAVDARNVNVSDTLPAGISYVSSNPRAAVSGQSLRWDLGNMAAGSSKNITVRVKADRTGKFTNCAEVKAEGGALSDRDCADTVVSAPKLALTKAGPTEVLLCDPIEYRLTVSNNGDAPAQNVRITDSLPDGLVTMDNQKTFSHNIGTLNAGQSRTVTTRVKALRKGTYSNKANATGDGGLTAESGTVRTVVREPALKVTKTGPSRLFAGRPVTFDITVQNTGDGPARNTVLTDPIPAGTTFLNASDGGRLSGGSATWNLGTLNAGQSRKVSITVNVTGTGRVTNTATASATCAADASDSATLEAEGIPAILLETVDLVDPVQVGQNTTYRITVTNQGSADGKNIVIRATLPSQIQYVRGSGATAATSRGNVVTFAPLARLAPGAEATWDLVVKTVAAADIRFKLSMTSDQSSVPVEETESTFIYE